jgi:hypothetical protein
VTVESVEKELAEIETSYRVRKKYLRALLAVVKIEAGTTNKKDGDNDGE